MSEITSAKKVLRFYSREEIKALEPFIKDGQSVSEKALAEFCAQNNRSFGSVQVYIYSKRKQNKQKRAYKKSQAVKADLTPVAKDQSIAKMSKGEFKIPVNNWNITNENGQMFLNIKF
jgi:hypothetical protein